MLPVVEATWLSWSIWLPDRACRSLGRQLDCRQFVMLCDENDGS